MYAKMNTVHRVLAMMAVCVALVGCLTAREEPFDDAKFEEAVGKLTAADINTPDARGNTHLHIAARHDKADMAQLLLAKGANAALVNQAGDTALHVAIGTAHPKTAKVLAPVGDAIFIKNAAGLTAVEAGLLRGADFYGALFTPQTAVLGDERGRIAAHYIAEKGDREAMGYWISARFPLSKADRSGITPLSIALKAGYIPMAVDMLQSGAAPVRGDTFYFQEAVIARNMVLRFEDGQTPLHIAAIQGQDAIVDFLLDHVLDTRTALDAQDSSGSTALHEAVRYGKIAVASKLLERGANPNIQDRMGKTPLLLILPRESQAAMYPLLLARGSNRSAKDVYGDTSLHVAIMSGVESAVFAQLSDRGIDINERNKQGVTPLAVAVEHKNTAIASYLVSHGADIHARDFEGRTPLTRAFTSSPECVRALVTKETAATRDSYGNTALHIAVANMSAFVKDMIDLGVDVTAKNNAGDSALSLAVQSNQKDVGEMLLTRGGGAQVFPANANNRSPLSIALSYTDGSREWIFTAAVVKATDGTGNTALHYAAEWKNDRAVSLLLDKRSQINAKNVNGQTALFHAVRANSPSTVELLVARGASSAGWDGFGNGPLHHAVHWDAPESAAAMLALGAPLDNKSSSGKTPLAEACRYGKIAMASLFITNGADVNMSDGMGKTVLMEAIGSGNIDIVELVLGQGASPQVQDRNGRNAYHDAVATGNLHIINRIRAAGGNPLSRDKEGRTPLSLAMGQGDLVIRTVLGYDLALIDTDGNTPIHVAIESGAAPDVLANLIALGYPVNWRNRYGDTPLMLAVTRQSVETAVVLLQNGADPYLSNNLGECPASASLKYMAANSTVITNIAKIAGSRSDQKGDTLLHYAAQITDEDGITTLLALGLDKTRRNSNGETPRDIALRWRKADVARVLQ